MSLHTLQLIIVFSLVALVFTAFLREWLSPDLVALSAMGLLLVTGILGTEETLAVFSNSAPIVIGCMFVLSAALERTGAIDALARLFLRLAGTSELGALVSLAVLTVPLSAFINNTPVVVVFMPVVLALARSTELKASRLLIPLSYFAILGGTCTLIGTSTNLLVDGVARHHGMAPFRIFEITPLGISAIVVVMLLAAFNVLSITTLALVAAILVVLTKCVDVEEVYEAIEWNLLFIIFGMLALGQAMETTGAAHLLATGVTGAFGRFGPAVTLSVMYFVAMVLTELISDNAVAVLLTPIACEIAATMGVDARPFCGRGDVWEQRQFRHPHRLPDQHLRFSARAAIGSWIFRGWARRSTSSSGSRRAC